MSNVALAVVRILSAAVGPILVALGVTGPSYWAALLGVVVLGSCSLRKLRSVFWGSLMIGVAVLLNSSFVVRLLASVVKYNVVYSIWVWASGVMSMQRTWV
jgi:hypothetical protein